MRITMTREALLERLEDRLKAAKEEDARLMKKHQEDEKKALGRFRETIRAAIKWDYKKLKQHYFLVRLDDAPSCPRSNALHIQGVINGVNMDTRKRPFSIFENSDIKRVLDWQPESKKPKKTLCD